MGQWQGIPGQYITPRVKNPDLSRLRADSQLVAQVILLLVWCTDNSARPPFFTRQLSEGSSIRTPSDNLLPPRSLPLEQTCHAVPVHACASYSRGTLGIQEVLI